ncbi:IclR family transcriptional regulator [Sulfitobacter sp. S190]|uniref:IclR family transcriptional regulator n=1 Tax=Sulfitobacter sp. S190 TaxID=2867022 RepID=UPI0021A5A9EB|nr:IclR family transcriptional regulator [Sulfitobacter sp. S190]UWR23018.1 IclR family transcriptional regulator [Sulfitobacter sp. S190]
MQSSIVHKLLALLSAVSAAQRPMTFTEIVDKTGMNKSTIHRLLSIGVDEQMLRFDEQRKVYLLGPRVFDLVRNAYNGYDIQAIALDEMVRLFDMFDVNVTIGVPSGNEVVYLRVLEAAQSMGGVQRPGMREPIHCSASGKALMAYYPEDVLRSNLKDYVFERFTERTVPDVETFRKELEFVRAQGFGRNDREEYDHFIGISSPIFNYMAEPIAVLNIWAVYPRHTIETLVGWSDELITSADRVTALIGGIRPDSGDLVSR